MVDTPRRTPQATRIPADLPVPEVIPGALAENASERPDEFGVPRDAGVVRLPEATLAALADPDE